MAVRTEVAILAPGRSRGTEPDQECLTKVKRPSRRRGRYEHAPEPQSKGLPATQGPSEDGGWSGLRDSSRFRAARIGPTIRVVGTALVVLAVTGAWLFRGDLEAMFETSTEVPASTQTAGTEVVVTPLTTRAASPVLPDLDEALRQAGYDSVSAVVDGEVVYLEGVIPGDRLQSGLFEYVDGARETVMRAMPGADVVNRLRVRGDAGTLAAEIDRLLANRPIAFEEGTLDLSDESLATISELAAAMNANPGVVVAVGGHTDSTGSAAQNREISARRAQAVVDALVAAGVAGNRLTVLAYGEAFPVDGAEPEQRIVFEVVG